MLKRIIHSESIKVYCLNKKVYEKAKYWFVLGIYVRATYAPIN